jgi:hypothetical protein
MNSDNKKTREEGIQPQRPFSVTLLVLIVLTIAGLSMTRFILTIRQWEFLAGWPGVSPLYMALSGFIWALVCIPVIWGLWQGYPWAARLTKAVALTYAMYYWLDRLFIAYHFGTGTVERGRYLLPTNWPFAVGITIIFLAFNAWTLSRPKAKAFFGENYE